VIISFVKSKGRQLVSVSESYQGRTLLDSSKTGIMESRIQTMLRQRNGRL